MPEHLPTYSFFPSHDFLLLQFCIMWQYITILLIIDVIKYDKPEISYGAFIVVLLFISQYSFTIYGHIHALLYFITR